MFWENLNKKESYNINYIIYDLKYDFKRETLTFQQEAKIATYT